MSLVLALLMLFNLVTQPAISIKETPQDEETDLARELFQKYEYLNQLSEKELEIFMNEFNTDEETLNELKLKNYKVEDAIGAIKIKTKHSINLERIEVLKNTYSDLQELMTILNKIDGFIRRSNISEEEKDKFIQELAEGNTIDKIIHKHIEENKKEPVVIGDNITKNITAGDSDDNKYTKEYDAPFTINKNNESINPDDGSLIYRYPIINLPGVNGLDIKLEAIYNSREAKLWGIVSSTTFNEKNNQMGIGWSWNLPVIEIDDSYIEYGDPDKYLHLGDGSVYEISGKITEGNSNLINHPSKDIQLNEDRGNFSNEDRSSRYVLTEKDGKQTYFARDGRLLGIRDRYGNTITFDHIIIEDHPVIDTITDTMGRTIKIRYRDTGIIVRGPEGERIELKFDEISYGGRTYRKKTIKNIIDPLGREIKIYYLTKKIWYSETDKIDLDSYDIEVNILDITYPTRGRTEYEYERTTENLGRKGAIERYRIKSRLDNDRNESRIYNKEIYTYSKNHSSGYPRYDNPRFLPNDFTYYTTVENEEGTKVRYTFDNEHLKIEEMVMDSTDKILKETIYKYDSRINKLPTTIRIKEYSASSNEYSKVRIRYEYDEYSNIISELDERGNEIINEYYYDDYNLPKRTEKYENEELKEKINYYLSRPRRRDIGESVSQNILDGEDKSIITKYDYDRYGNIIEKIITGIGGTRKENYQYFSNAYISQITITDENDTISSLEEYTYDLNTALKESSTDGNGNTIRYEYDRLRRPIKTINSDNTQKTIEYDDINNQIIITDENNYITKLIYNALGNHIKTEQEINGRTIAIEEKGYNNLSQLEWIKDGNENITRYEYDKLGRIIKTINPDNTHKTIVYHDDQRTEVYIDEENRISYNKYDEVGNIIEQKRQNGNSEEISYTTYNYNNNILRYKDNNGNITRYRYDQLGNLVEITNSIGETTKYEYNYLGNIIKTITAEGSITTKKYDSTGRMTKETDPMGKVREITYDLAGNIIKETETSKGRTITKNYRYNTRNQQIEKVDQEGITTYTYDNMGSIIKVTDKNGTVTNTYNPEGRVETIRQSDGKTISYKYDNNGNVTETIDHYGEVTQNTYDSRNRLETVIQKGQITEYQYYKNGQTKEIQYPNRTKIQHTYDETGNLIRLTNIGVNGKIIGQYKYIYDPEGNQLIKEENGKLVYYTYDPLNRVNTIEEEGTLTTYKYDKNGNIQEKEIKHSPSSIHAIKEEEGTRIIPNIKNHKINYIYDKGNKLTRSKEEIESQEIDIKTTSALGNQVTEISITPNKQIQNIEINAPSQDLGKGLEAELELIGTNTDGSKIEDSILEQGIWTSTNPNLELKSNKGRIIKVIYKGEKEEQITNNNRSKSRRENSNSRNKNRISRDYCRGNRYRRNRGIRTNTRSKRYRRNREIRTNTRDREDRRDRNRRSKRNKRNKRNRKSRTRRIFNGRNESRNTTANESRRKCNLLLWKTKHNNRLWLR